MSDYIWRTIFISDSSTGVDSTGADVTPKTFWDTRFVVPNDRYWRIVSARVTSITAGQAGNRVLGYSIDFGDTLAGGTSTDPYVEVRVGAVQAANTTRYHQLAPGLPRLTAFEDTDYLTTPIPDIELPPGTTIRFYDNVAVGSTTAFDDLDVRLVIESRGKSV